MTQTLTIEVDGPANESLHFRPLGRSIRGRFDFARIAEPQARIEAAKWPVPIPSQRLSIDANGKARLIETLHEPEHAAIKERIEKKGMKLEATQEFENVDLASWYFWIKRAVESGLARIVSGKLPDKLPGKPRMNYVLNEPEPSPTVTLTESFNRLAEAIEDQTAAILQVLKSK